MANEFGTISGSRQKSDYLKVVLQTCGPSAAHVATFIKDKGYPIEAAIAMSLVYHGISYTTASQEMFHSRQLAKMWTVADEAFDLDPQSAYMDRRVQLLVVGWRRGLLPHPAHSGEEAPGLTFQQRQMLALRASGLTREQVAKTVKLSLRRATVHLDQMHEQMGLEGGASRTRFGLRDDTPLLLEAVRRNILRPPVGDQPAQLTPVGRYDHLMTTLSHVSPPPHVGLAYENSAAFLVAVEGDSISNAVPVRPQVADAWRDMTDWLHGKFPPDRQMRSLERHERDDLRNALQKLGGAWSTQESRPSVHPPWSKLLHTVDAPTIQFTLNFVDIKGVPPGRTDPDVIRYLCRVLSTDGEISQKEMGSYVWGPNAPARASELRQRLTEMHQEAADLLQRLDAPYEIVVYADGWIQHRPARPREPTIEWEGGIYNERTGTVHFSRQQTPGLVPLEARRAFGELVRNTGMPIAKPRLRDVSEAWPRSSNTTLVDALNHPLRRTPWYAFTTTGSAIVAEFPSFKVVGGLQGRAGVPSLVQSNGFGIGPRGYDLSISGYHALCAHLKLLPPWDANLSNHEAELRTALQTLGAPRYEGQLVRDWAKDILQRDDLAPIADKNSVLPRGRAEYLSEGF